MKTALTILTLVILSLNSPIILAKNKLLQPGSSSKVAVQTVNINTANADQLSSSLKGVGLKKAQAIIAYRDQFGAFKSLDELTAVKGIGEKTLAKNRSKISL